MQRRKILKQAISYATIGFTGSTLAEDFGTSKGFPGGWPPLNQRGGQPLPWGNEDYLVNNFSGGMEPLFKNSTVHAQGVSSIFKSKPTVFKLSFAQTFADYQRKHGKTAMLIARGDTIFYENYEFARAPGMRFYSKSMAKGVLGILTGLAVENEVIKSLDDPIEKYDDRLKGRPLGTVKIRHALNMSSGVNLCQVDCGQRNDFERWEEQAFAGSARMDRQKGRLRALNTDADKVAINWEWGFNQIGGTRYNYQHIDPHLVSMAIRGGSKSSIAEFTEKALWQPMGAQADAVWLTDSNGVEEVGGSFCATLRDWGRIGLLIANKGSINGKQVLRESWFNSYRDFSADENYLKPGNIPNKPRKEGYKNFLHIPYTASSWLRFGGDLGQSIYADQKTGTVMVVLSVSNQDGQGYDYLFKEALATLA